MEVDKSAATDSTSSSSSGRITGRKGSLSQVGERSDSRRQGRRHYSLGAILDRMRLRRSTRNQRPNAAMIPPGLSDKEISVYQTLLDFIAANPKRMVPNVVVITDLAKDFDDLAAMIVLKEFHRLGLIKLVGFIANLMPANQRASFGRGALDSLGLRDIPIAAGTSGFPKAASAHHDVLPYEFACDFMATDDRIKEEFQGNGEDLLRELCQKAIGDENDEEEEKQERKLTLLLISSLEDIYTFSQNEPDLLRKAVSNIVLQGGYTISEDGKLEPDQRANNNRYDPDAATYFHTFIQDNEIPSTVYTKVAAYATPLTPTLFAELAKTNHPLGRHLELVQVRQDVAFYESALKRDPKKRFAPFMDQEWFLKNKTNWYEVQAARKAAGQKPMDMPTLKNVTTFLTKVIVYDALAAIGASGTDVLSALEVLTDAIDDTSSHNMHRVVGFAGPPEDPGVNTEKMTNVLSALLKGSLLSCPPANT